MIARWWRNTRAPYEEWHLVALKPNGYWAPLAIAASRQPEDKAGWRMTACVTPGGKGSVWMGSEVQTFHPTRAGAFRGGEVLVGLQAPLKRAIWLPIERGWLYPPPARRGRQKARAGQEGDLVEFLASFAQLLADVVGARRVVQLEETRRVLERVIRDLAKGDLDAMAGRLECCTYDEVEEDPVNALIKAQNTLERYKKARSRL